MTSPNRAEKPRGPSDMFTLEPFASVAQTPVATNMKSGLVVIMTYVKLDKPGPVGFDLVHSDFALP